MKIAWTVNVGIAMAALLAAPSHAQFSLPPGLEGLMMQMPGTAGRGGMPPVDCKQLEALSRSGAGAGTFDTRALMAMMGCKPPPAVAAAAREEAAVTTDCPAYRDMLVDAEGARSDWLGPMHVMAARELAEKCGDKGATAHEQRAREGFLRFAEGRFQQSAQAFSDAHDVASSELMRTRYRIEMGKSLLAAGRIEESQQAFEKALAAVAPGSRLRSELLILLGIVALDMNNDAAALERLLEVEKLAQAQAREQNIEITLNPFLARHAAYLAVALRRAGRQDEARAILDRMVTGREQVVGMADQTQQILPMMQQALSSVGIAGLFNTPEMTRGLANTETMKLTMGEILALNLACSLLEEFHLDAGRPETALEVAERCRGRALARLLASRAFQRPTAPAFPTHQEVEAYAKLHRLDYHKAGEALVKARMGTREVDAASRPANIADMRRIAAERKATLIVYSIAYAPNRLPNRMPDRETGMTIWVVAPDGTISVRRRRFDGVLPEGTLTLTAAALRAHEALGVPGRGAAPTERERPKTDRTAAALRQFYRLLIEPVEDLLPSGEGARLLIVPQGPLFLVPFAALENAQGAPLVARYSLSLAPSLQTLSLTGARRQARSSGAAVIVGNPVMPTYPTPPGAQPVVIPPLPGAEHEANAISALLKTPAMIGAAATKAAVMARIRDARYVHLATHGFLDDAFDQGPQGVNPHLREVLMLEQRAEGGHKTPGMLALSPSGKDGGMLTADEIALATTGAELVVMSACGSGQGAINDDGVIGLSRAWMAAGAPSVVVSLWAIPDEPTRDLMVEFYTRLVAGSGKAEALRAAMLATRVKYPNPVNWAAFVLLGEPD
jgi:CHAT domain-containing protein/tetratricopeptide (TPR) repeat protein